MAILKFRIVGGSTGGLCFCKCHIDIYIYIKDYNLFLVVVL